MVGTVATIWATTFTHFRAYLIPRLAPYPHDHGPGHLPSCCVPPPHNRPNAKPPRPIIVFLCLPFHDLAFVCTPFYLASGASLAGGAWSMVTGSLPKWPPPQYHFIVAKATRSHHTPPPKCRGQHWLLLLLLMHLSKQFTLIFIVQWGGHWKIWVSHRGTS